MTFLYPVVINYEVEDSTATNSGEMMSKGMECTYVTQIFQEHGPSFPDSAGAQKA